MENVYIVSAVRTPIDGYQKSLASFTSAELGALVMKAAFGKAFKGDVCRCSVISKTFIYV